MILILKIKIIASHSIKDINTPNELYFVFSCQEEVGARGSITSSFKIVPDIGLVCEVAHGIDYPHIKKEKHGDIKLGKGPVIDMGPNINPKLFKKIVKIAEKNDIQYQVRVSGRPTPTDLRYIQITREGVATALISAPLRYMHSPVEVMDLDDINETVKLFTILLQKLKSDINLKL